VTPFLSTSGWLTTPNPKKIENYALFAAFGYIIIYGDYG
jgi:hypothetical protein